MGTTRRSSNLLSDLALCAICGAILMYIEMRTDYGAKIEMRTDYIVLSVLYCMSCLLEIHPARNLPKF